MIVYFDCIVVSVHEVIEAGILKFTFKRYKIIQK
jgi:hypothetical protein